MLQLLAVVALLVQFTSAHFSIQYPYWRGDSFATQYTRPCGGVNQSLSNNNRTLWPLTGGAVQIKGSHPWAITYVNLALGGDNTTTFNISLVPGFNQTGNGTFCLPKITLPSSLQVTDGLNASIQVIQIGETGSSLYNCADITFSSNAAAFDSCTNSTGVGGRALSASSSSSNGTCAVASAPAATASTSNAIRTVGDNLYSFAALFVAGWLSFGVSSM